MRLRRVTLVSFAVAISVVFLWMIRDFLVALLFAALAAGLMRPLYRKLLRRFGGRKNLAAAFTVTVLLLGGVLPVVGFAALVGVQAIELAKTIQPWMLELRSGTAAYHRILETFPSLKAFTPYRDQLLTRLGELGGQLGSLAIGWITTAAGETLSFLLLVFVMLYATFGFLTDGRELLRKMLYYFPLPADDEDRLVERFVSVARATMKGTLVIGLVQGALGGLAFWVAGLSGAAVWAAAMAALSIVPGIGAAAVWIPAVAYLFIVGRVGAALGLLAWCVAVVSTVDNFLRPWLVGKDSKMSDLLVLISTLGGIVLVGPLGFVVGPLIAVLFVTVWEIYGEVFRDVLPEAPPLSRGSLAPPSRPE